MLWDVLSHLICSITQHISAAVIFREGERKRGRERERERGRETEGREREGERVGRGGEKVLKRWERGRRERGGDANISGTIYLLSFTAR